MTIIMNIIWILCAIISPTDSKITIQNMRYRLPPDTAVVVVVIVSCAQTRRFAIELCQ